MWLSRAQVEDLITSIEFELVKIPEGSESMRLLKTRIRPTPKYSTLPLARSGRFESYAAADGVYRLFSYRQMGDLPLVVSVGQSTTDIYKPWRRYATAIGVMMIVLCGISVTFAMYLAREMRRRTEAETILETLAATDGLTGLSNRRTFNAAIEREWRRAARNGSELALLMIDNDHFKRYNDLYGHQAGDGLLQTLGAAMLVSIRRGNGRGGALRRRRVRNRAA